MDDVAQPPPGDVPQPAEAQQPQAPTGPRAEVALALLLYALLLDAAVETYLSGSSLRWLVAGSVAGCLAITILLWRRLSWAARAGFSLLAFLAILTATTWLPGGLTQGVVAARQPTATVLAAATALATLGAAAILVRLRFIPVPAKALIGLLGLYSAGAFGFGIATLTPYSDLFHGRSLWDRLPFWLQGAVVGALGVVPLAALATLILGIARVRGPNLRAWAVQFLALGLSAALAVAGFVTPLVPAGPGVSQVAPAAQPSQTAPPAPEAATPPETPAPPQTAPGEQPESPEPQAAPPEQQPPAPPQPGATQPAPGVPPAQPSQAAPLTGVLFFTTYAQGCEGSTNVHKVTFTYVPGASFVLDTPDDIACTTPGADGVVFAPDGDLIVGGQGDEVHKVNPATGKFSTVPAGVGAYHVALDPSGTKAWVSGIPGALATVRLAPFATGTLHPLSGDDTDITSIAWDRSGRAYYTSSASFGYGSFGLINLTTFKTKRILRDLPAAHGMTFDAFTGHLILMGDGHITQVAPGNTPTIVSDLAVSAAFADGDSFNLDQGTVDGKGHLFAASNSGHLVFVDYSSTGLVADPRNFRAAPFLVTYLDDVAPLSGPGSAGYAPATRPSPERGQLLVRYAPEVQALNRNLEIVFDASGSMNARLEKGTRFSVAKQVLADLVRRLPPDVSVSMRVFGHRRGGQASCTDSELLITPGRPTPETFIRKVNALRARGETPLVSNLLLAGRDLTAGRGGTVVAITDGEESCGGDVRTVGARLRALGVPLVVNIVGFNLPTAEATRDWKLAAGSTGGRFFDARTAGQLASALREAVQLQYVVYDRNGKAAGTARVGQALRLPEGVYTLVVRAGQPIKVEGVRVSPQKSVTYTLRRAPTGWILTGGTR